ncbi:MAG: ATP synthase F1 subunit delta [Bacteroidetes bacterium]|nr:ATP synthase F1 subunit delta [Bacteroidota bacterium]
MSSPVARRYAQAFLADAGNDVAAVDADFALIAATVRESRDLRLMLASPVISRDKKRRVVDALFGGKIGARAQQFVGLLFDKEREALLADVAEAYADLRNEQQGIEVAQVRVPAELSKAEADRLRAALEAQTGKTLLLEVAVDTAMIGGLVVRIGDTVYDGSVRFRLDALRDRLLDGAFVN